MHYDISLLVSTSIIMDINFLKYQTDSKSEIVCVHVYTTMCLSAHIVCVCVCTHVSGLRLLTLWVLSIKTPVAYNTYLLHLYTVTATSDSIFIYCDVLL